MSRSLLAGAAAMVAAGFVPLAPAVVFAQTGAEETDRAAITVMAPRARQTGRSATGAPIMTLTAQSVVYYDDLNLRSEADRRRLSERVEAAAREACAWLDEVYPPSPTTSADARDCRADAVASAKEQVEAAIAGYD